MRWKNRNETIKSGEEREREEKKTTHSGQVQLTPKSNTHVINHFLFVCFTPHKRKEEKRKEEKRKEEKRKEENRKKKNQRFILLLELTLNRFIAVALD